MAMTDEQEIRITAANTVAGSGKVYMTMDEMLADMLVIVAYLTSGTTP